MNRLRATPRERSLGRVGRVALAGVVVAGAMLAAIDPLTLTFFLSYALVGSLLVVRRPANAIGWLLLVISWGFVGTTTRPDLDIAALQAGTETLGDFLFAWVGSWSGSAFFAGFGALAILFPSGRLPDGRGRKPTIAFLCVGIGLVVLTATAPTFAFNPDGNAEMLIMNRLALLPSLPAWSLVPPNAWILLTMAWLGVAVVAMVCRYLRSKGIDQLQLRWLVSAVVFVAVAVVFGLASLGLFGEAVGGLAWLPAIVAYPTVPIAIGIAITRYRLYEIDRIVSRTLGYAIVTGVLALVFVGAILGLTSLLGELAGGNTIAVAASTLIAAALFQPLRRRVQRAVDRRFDRARYDGQRLAADFAWRLRDEVDLPTIERDLRSTVDIAVRPSSVGLWLRGGWA